MNAEFQTSDAKRLIDFLATRPMPLMIFSRNLYSWLGSAIASETRGIYNHFMWLISPAAVASQDWFFNRSLINKYLSGKHALKFVTCDHWSGYQRATLLKTIRQDLSAPWYRRIYDPLQILGIKIGMPWLQIPGLSICSDRARYIGVVDRRYNMRHPTPSGINRWQKTIDGYRVECRYVPDDA